MRREITDEERQAYAEGLMLLARLVVALPRPAGHRTFRVFTLILPEHAQAHAA